MATKLNRRRFIAISASLALLPWTALAATPVARWRGAAMGAGASLQLVGLTTEDAAGIFQEIEAELSRLEDIFSLYRPDSALSRLNRQGQIAAPPPEMTELLGLVDAVHDITGGVFDPTVQPLWSLHAAAAATGERPDAKAVAVTADRVGWRKVHHDTSEIAFRSPGMALTLNGVAQGFVTDRIAALLENRGFADVLVDMGELRGIGARPDGTAWRAGIASPDGRLVEEVRLANRALATSAPMGTVLDPAGRIGHIIDPRDGSIGKGHALVSVSASSAAIADALSTGFCLLSRTQIAQSLKHWTDARLEYLA